MSELDDLRAILDERGCNHIDTAYDTTWLYYSDPHCAQESMDGTLIVTGLTAEQAVDATLGRGTCEFNVVEEFITGKRQRANICECSNCGYRCAYGFIVDERFKCCPNCGKRIRKAVG